MFRSIFCSVSGLLLCRPLEMQDVDFAACFSLRYSRCGCRDSSGAQRCCSHLSTSQSGCLIRLFIYYTLKKRKKKQQQTQQFKPQPKSNPIPSPPPHGVSSCLLLPSLQQRAATAFNKFTSSGHCCIQQRRTKPRYSVLHATDDTWKTATSTNAPSPQVFCFRFSS